MQSGCKTLWFICDSRYKVGVGETRLDTTLHRACLYCATGTAVYSPCTRCLLSLRRVCVGVCDGVFCDAHTVRYAVTAFLTSPLNPTRKTLNGSSVFFLFSPHLGCRRHPHCVAMQSGCKTLWFICDSRYKVGVGETRLDTTLHRACLYCATGTAVYSPCTRCLLSLRRVCVGVCDGVFCDAHTVRYAVTAFLTSPLNPTRKTLNGSSVFFLFSPHLGCRRHPHCATLQSGCKTRSSGV